MNLLFVHGWSVSHTDTYGGLPEALQAAAPKKLKLRVREIHLGKYISFHDEVTVDDIARAFDKARLDTIGTESFSCITHSTGGPVIRTWIDRYFGRNLGKSPLRHLIMLAPANHGSALAQLGKKRVSRIKSWFQGVEPGTRVLDWLELGSQDGWDLNHRWLNQSPVRNKLFSFVITGQTIDSKLFDHLNSYTGEKGSDGVVRVAAANMNYRYLRLTQTDEVLFRKKRMPVFRLAIADGTVKSSPSAPLAILPKCSHSGKKLGIMRSVKETNADTKPVIPAIIKCLQVDDAGKYKAVGSAFRQLSEATQNADPEIDQYTMVVFRLMDDRGEPITDYDLLLLSTDAYDPDELPKGFFVDRQANKLCPNHLVYYLDCTKMLAANHPFGFRVTARPDDGFCYYRAGQFQSEELELSKLLVPNQVIMVDIEIKRRVDENVFRLAPLSDKRASFKRVKPSGTDLP